MGIGQERAWLAAFRWQGHQQSFCSGEGASWCRGSWPGPGKLTGGEEEASLLLPHQALSYSGPAVLGLTASEVASLPFSLLSSSGGGGSDTQDPAQHRARPTFLLGGAPEVVYETWDRSQAARFLGRTFYLLNQNPRSGARKWPLKQVPRRS